MPRPRLAMTPAEVAAFLAAKRLAVIGTLDAQGAPDGEPADVSCVDGTLLVRVAADGPAQRNLRRDPRVVCALEEFPSYAEIRGVSLHGRAVPVGVSDGQATFHVTEPRVESFDFRKMRRPGP